MTHTAPAPRSTVPWGAVSGVVGALVFVEITSGILQGYYTPLLTDIARALGVADADVTWLEAVQLAVSALTVPLLAAAGDRVGHKRVLMISSAITAVASWGLLFTGNVPLFFVSWALQGLYAVWLPAEIALIHSRARALGAPGPVTRRAAGLLIGALELGVIVGAIGAGAIASATGSLSATMVVPAVVTTACFFVILFFVKEAPGGRSESSSKDIAGIGLLALSLASIMSGLSVLRALGPGTWQPWAFVVLGLALLVLFARVELRAKDPMLDLRVLSNRRQWPVQMTAFLFGMSVLGAQAPLATFGRTDPAVHGYGLGLSVSQSSYVIGAYVLSLAVGALFLPLLTRRLPLRDALIIGAAITGVGYLLFLFSHGSLSAVLSNMIIAGLGSGVLLASLPAAAAAAAPPERTGMATGATNAVKTLGGAIASAVFGLVLAHGGVLAGGAAPLAGYLTVWAICGCAAILAALLLAAVPRHSLQD